MKIYTVVNQKGGVGKSSTVQALVSGMTLLADFKCLAIDLDAQRNLTYSTGCQDTGKTSLGVLTGEITAKEAIQHTPSGDVIPASGALAGADAFLCETGKEYRLLEALEPLKDEYDYIFIDTPPALSILTINALTASDGVIIPAHCDAYSLQGITELAGTIETVRKYCNPALKIEGVLLTRYQGRQMLTQEAENLINAVAAKLGTSLFKTRIREAVAVKEAQFNQESIFTYPTKSKVVKDYEDLIEELIERRMNE